MIILGIETSCDETAAAVVKDGPSTTCLPPACRLPAGKAGRGRARQGSGFKILSSVVASSEELHKKSGGIIPEVAAREQIRCIMPVVQQATQNSKLKTQNLDAIAVTVGPGLVGSLLVGVETAKTLAYVWKKPIIPINHLQAHIYANWIESENRREKTEDREPKFPAIGLVVSGGHTDLVLMENHGKIKWIGGTRDDAAGECFDKCARILGLPYPGGPEIAKMAMSNVKCKMSNVKLPRPMMKTADFDFSFAGLKTAVINLTYNLKLKTKNKNLKSLVLSALSFEIQEAVTDVLVEKTILAAEKFKVKRVLLAGGVAANERLREKMELRIKHHKLKIDFFVPPPMWCTDNAVCVAVYAFYNYKPVSWQKLKSNPSLRIEEIV
jgi:N6-L-threonylcarbamoyladenine synthase